MQCSDIQIKAPTVNCPSEVTGSRPPLLRLCRVPAADQMVPGLAALRPAHAGADLRPPLDEDDDDNDVVDARVAPVGRGAGRRRHPPQDHRHRLFVKHNLEQRESLKVDVMD